MYTEIVNSKSFLNKCFIYFKGGEKSQRKICGEFKKFLYKIFILRGAVPGRIPFFSERLF